MLLCVILCVLLLVLKKQKVPFQHVPQEECSQPEEGHKGGQKKRKKDSEKVLPGRESNPGLPRDRRRYLPLYYRGLLGESAIILPYQGVYLSNASRSPGSEL